MKTIRFSLLATLALGLFTLTGCQEKESQNVLTVSPEALVFAAGESVGKTVVVATDAPEWKAVAGADDEWITLSQEESTLTVSMNETHKGTEPREGSVIVTAGNAEPKTIAVTQEAKQSLTVSPTALVFAADESAGKTVAVTTDALEWKAEPGADDDWITLTQEGSALTVSMNETHNGTEQRKGSIIVTAGNAESVTIAITQEAKQSLSVSPTSILFAAGETGVRTLTVSTNAADGWKASAAADWLRIVPLANNRFNVTVDDLHYGNADRHANITVTAGNATPVTVSVRQEATVNTISLSSSTAHLGAYTTGTESVARITITTDAPDGWKASESTSWFTLSTTGNGVLIITATEENRSEYPREGIITVTAGGATKTITVIQADNAPVFGDIKSGTYTATGTPGFLNTPGPGTWTGTIRPNVSGQYYELTNFGGDGITVRLNFSGGQIYMDGTYKAAENDTHNGYFRVYYEEGTYWTVMGSAYRHPVTYDKAPRTITFGSYVTTEPSRPTAKVGVVAFPKSGNTYGAFTDLYSNLKIRLNSTRSDANEPAAEPTTGHKLKQTEGKFLPNAQIPSGE